MKDVKRVCDNISTTLNIGKWNGKCQPRLDLAADYVNHKNNLHYGEISNAILFNQLYHIVLLFKIYIPTIPIKIT